jgi:hypothetical protein
MKTTAFNLTVALLLAVLVVVADRWVNDSTVLDPILGWIGIPVRVLAAACAVVEVGAALFVLAGCAVVLVRYLKARFRVRRAS